MPLMMRSLLALPLPRRLAVVLMTTSVVACAGSTTPPSTSKPSGTGERDTAINHEPCDKDAASAKKVDANGDGTTDITHVMKGGREACRILDLNLDGAVDAYVYYDDKGVERRRESDFDRDGRADEIVHYDRGAVVLKERETNFDDKLDTWDYYEGGRLVRRERDSDGDKFIDQWWQFNNPTNPSCAVVATDQNADGKPDPNSVVDLCAESYGAPKLSPAPASSVPAPPASAAPADVAPATSAAPAGSASSPPIVKKGP
jgi:hypothetical protein